MLRGSSSRKPCIESLTPIVKLTNGFSVTLLPSAVVRSGLADLATVKPLKVSSPQRATIGNLAELMVERKGGIATESPCAAASRGRGGCAERAMRRPGSLEPRRGRAARPAAADRHFGAARNAVLKQTPTFARSRVIQS